MGQIRNRESSVCGAEGRRKSCPNREICGTKLRNPHSRNCFPTSKPAQGTPLQKGKTSEGENAIGDWFASLSSPSPAAKTPSNRPASGDWLGGIRSTFGGDAQDAASSGRPASASSPMREDSATHQSRPSSQNAAAAPPSPSV